jgi:hypothetical protein
MMSFSIGIFRSFCETTAAEKLLSLSAMPTERAVHGIEMTRRLNVS